MPWTTSQPSSWKRTLLSAGRKFRKTWRFTGRLCVCSERSDTSSSKCADGRKKLMLCSTSDSEDGESEAWKGAAMKLANTVHDPVDSALAAFLDVSEFKEQLGLLWPAVPEWGSVERIQTGVLKCHTGRRCAFEISLKTGSVSHELIGKVYNKERPYVFEVMTAIRLAGFDEHAEFSIPQPLAYVPSLRLLLVSKAKGLHGAQVFLGG